MFAALRAGASGFILKRASADAIITAVRTVASGDSTVFPQAVRNLALRHVDAAIGYDGPELTQREHEVLRLGPRV